MRHVVSPLKYRKDMPDEKTGATSSVVCKSISERYEIEFVEIGYESDHVRFLVRVPETFMSQIVRMVKSVTAREMFRLYPEVRMKLWGGDFRTSGFYANTIGLYAGKEVIREYIKNQVRSEEYTIVHSQQLRLSP